MNSRSRSSSSGGALGEHRGESAHRRPDRRGADREQGDQVKPFREQIADRIGGAPQRPRRSRARAVAHPIPPNPPARERRDALTIWILARMRGPRPSLDVFRHSSSRSRGDVGRVGRAGPAPAGSVRPRPGAPRHCAAAAGHRRRLVHRRHGGATNDRCRRAGVENRGLLSETQAAVSRHETNPRGHAARVPVRYNNLMRMSGLRDR